MIGQYLIDFFHYILDNKEQIFSLLLEHIRMTFIAVGIAILIGVPLGLLISYVKKANKAVLAVASVIQAIPSMALLGIAIPLLGIGVLPSIVVVVLYSLLPIIKILLPEYRESIRSSWNQPEVSGLQRRKCCLKFRFLWPCRLLWPVSGFQR